MHGIEQLDIGLSNGSLDSWSTTVFPWIYMYWNQFDIDMLTDINKAFTIATIFFKMKWFRVLQLSIPNKQERESEQIVQMMQRTSKQEELR